MAKKKAKIPQASAQKHVRINPIARAPILRKGGAHQKSRSSERQQEKCQLRKLLDKAGAGHPGSADFLDYAFQHSMC